MAAGETGGSRRLALAIAIAALLFVALIIVSPSGAAPAVPAVPPTDATTGLTTGTDGTTSRWLLSVTIRGSGSVGGTVTCSQTTTRNTDAKPCTVKSMLDGDQVTLSANPDPGFSAVSFDGPAGCNGSTCSFTITGDTAVTVNFVDNTPPPAANITGPSAAPAVVRSDDAAALTFTTNSDTVATRCAVDTVPQSQNGCSTPWRLPAMTDGTHTLHVSSLDVNGNIIDVTRQISYVNVPDTTIAGEPAEGGAANSTATSFSFPGTALCKLDAAAVACTNGAIAAALNGEPDGAHTLSVAAGVQIASTAYYDKTPALRHWTIDTAAPVTSISSGPPTVTSDPFATFAFSAPSLTPVSYECSLDGGAFSGCASGVRYDSLATGTHTFAVRGTDAAGNHGDARTQSWNVVSPSGTPAPTPGGGNPAGSGGSTGTGGSTGPGSTQTPIAPRRVAGNFTWRFRWKGSKTWFTRLKLTGVTKGAKVAVACHGHGCPHGRRLTLRKLVGHKLRKGAVIEVRITKAGMTGAVVDLVVGRAGKDPTMRTKCLAPGARRASSC